MTCGMLLTLSEPPTFDLYDEVTLGTSPTAGCDHESEVRKRKCLAKYLAHGIQLVNVGYQNVIELNLVSFKLIKA